MPAALALPDGVTDALPATDADVVADTDALTEPEPAADDDAASLGEPDGDDVAVTDAVPVDDIVLDGGVLVAVELDVEVDVEVDVPVDDEDDVIVIVACEYAPANPIAKIVATRIAFPCAIFFRLCCHRSTMTAFANLIGVSDCG